MVKNKELMQGNWVLAGKKTQFPMQVVGIFSDVVYLDFEGNEGDVWEEKEEDLFPISITEELLEKNGFVLDDDIICDMQDGMAESMKSYVDTFNYALQSEMMHIPTEIRKKICDFIIIKAIIETSSLVAERIMRRKDRELHSSYMISQKMLKLMFAPYEDKDNPIDLNNSDRVNQAAEIFINKLMQYQKIV